MITAQGARAPGGKPEAAGLAVRAGFIGVCDDAGCCEKVQSLDNAEYGYADTIFAVFYRLIDYTVRFIGGPNSQFATASKINFIKKCFLFSFNMRDRESLEG